MTDFDLVIDRSDSSSLKWEKYRDRDIIPMWVADMDFPSPDPIIQALKGRVSHGIFGYTLPPRSLVNAAVDYIEQEFSWQVDPSWLVWIPGLVTGINVSCRACGEPGQSVLTHVPAYPPFLSAPGLSGRKLSTLPMHVDGTWKFDRASLNNTAALNAGMFLLCNPHNPTGRVFTKDELLQIAEFCMAHSLVLCSDEIHNGLVLDRDKKHVPAASISPEIADLTITLMAPSKTFNLPGMGCSFAVIPNSRIRQRFTETMEGIVPHVTCLGYTAAEAAFAHGRAWHRGLIQYLRHSRHEVESCVARLPRLSMEHTEATYLAWIDTRQLGLDDPVRFFEDRGVGLSNGADFGMPGFVRLNFACPRSRLMQALQRISDAVSSK